MKKLISLSVLVILLASCSSSGKYEKAIADFVQTDKKGTKYDLKFKALDLKELQKITVADSINYLSEKWDEEKNKKLQMFEESLGRSKKSLEIEENARFSSKTMIEFHNNSIVKYEQAIDSVKSRTPDWVKIYDDRKKDEILAILVECRYKATPPMVNTEIEETRDFVLTPDGNKCYSQSAPKKN